MKKILIISDGQTGKHFIDRVMKTFTNENMYYVVETKSKNYSEINPARFKFYEFDPTSLYKLSNLLKINFAQVVIVMDELIDVQNTIKNIRSVKKQLRIIVLNKWCIENEDPNIVLVNLNEILSSRLIDYLPNVPVIAQNVGLGEGEIMEVLVPFGSSFVYRHIGVIEQKEWRIVAIYRNRKLVIPNRRRMIQPNDLLLLVGEPLVLKSVYKAIKRERGQFPEPFGTNIYLYIDMNLLNLKTAKKLVSEAIFVQEKLRKTLIIKIINPTHIETLWEIKEFRSDDVIIDINYDTSEFKKSFLQDVKAFHIGLVIVSKEMFCDCDTRKMIYNAHIPVLKIADKPISSLKEACIILGENRDLEKISSTIFDVSEQMSYNIELYNYLGEHQDEKEQVIEHYYNLSSIFSKNIRVIKESENPIKVLRKKDNFIQVLPFTKKLTQRRIFSFFSTDSERLYHRLDDYHQLFVPIQI